MSDTKTTDSKKVENISDLFQNKTDLNSALFLSSVFVQHRKQGK